MRTATTKPAQRTTPGTRSVMRRAMRPARIVGNMMINGAGAETLQDRGSHARGAMTLNPYFAADFQYRWQEYARWYATSWEARKIIDIPVDDALRKPVKITGLEDTDRLALEEACAALRVPAQLRRALIQERLLGGCILLPVLLRPEHEPTDEPLDMESVKQGDLQALNVIDVSRVTREGTVTDPFSPEYDAISVYGINGVRVHVSRLCVLDGAPLFGRAGGAGRILAGRVNPAGFGDSKLAPLYDLLNRVIGTQQGAFHLVNMASCLLVEVSRLKNILASGTDSPSGAALRRITEQLSLYRGAVIEGQDVKINQHAASFGSVPELVMTFAQLLSAASDIPATRFLGQAPGGLNATGEGDRENYYDMVGAYQTQRVKPVQRAIFNMTGASLWGWDAWAAKSERMELVYPSLKTLSEAEELDMLRVRAQMIRELCAANLISRDAAVKELVALDMFVTPGEAEDFMEDHNDDSGADSPTGQAPDA